MFHLKENIVKAWITSTIGTILMVISIILWITGVIPIKWDATIGIAIGTILLLAPQKIETIVVNLAKNWSGGSPNCEESSTKPDNPDK